jgi:hypothetical protein
MGGRDFRIYHKRTFVGKSDVHIHGRTSAYIHHTWVDILGLAFQINKKRTWRPPMMVWKNSHI